MQTGNPKTAVIWPQGVAAPAVIAASNATASAAGLAERVRCCADLPAYGDSNPSEQDRGRTWKQLWPELENALGHGFARVPSCWCARSTHRSLANEQRSRRRTRTAQNEAREATTSGSSFWATRCSAWWWRSACFCCIRSGSEGELTRVRAQLVSRQHMAQVAEEIGLGRHLRLSRGEDRSGLRRKSTVLSNTMEAVIGALFLDGGLEPVRAFARRHVMGEAAEQLAEELALRRGAGQLQIGAPGAVAGRARRHSGLPCEERERPRPSQAVSGRGAAEGGARRTGQAAGARHGQHQETSRNRMRRAARLERSQHAASSSGTAGRRRPKRRKKTAQ